VPTVTEADVAATLIAAARLLRQHGMHAGDPADYWPAASNGAPWDGQPLDPTGAIAVAAGARTAADVHRLLGHVDHTQPDAEPVDRHPAYDAVFAHLGIDLDDEHATIRFFRWCDLQMLRDVTHMLERVAAIQAGVAA
jgi:hypothetical protein